MTEAGQGWRPYSNALDLSPTSIESFLRVSGWTRIAARPGVLSIWQDAQESARIRLPFDRTYDDYSARFEEAVELLSEVTQMRGEALQLEVASARSDILLLRADQFSTDGTIPLSEGQGLLEGAHKMLMAAACSAVRPKAVHRGRKPVTATSFMKEDVRLGHTFRGSYVITIFARVADEVGALTEDKAHPVTPSDGVENNPVGDEDIRPFARQVMDTLATGVNALTHSVGLTPDFTLDEAIQEGTSVEMIQSLGSMARLEGVRALDLSFKWSKSVPLEDDRAPQVSRVVVDRELAEEITAFIPIMERRPEPEGDSVAGQVTRLERGIGKEDGVVVIDGIVGRHRRLVRMSLEGADYVRATDNHANHAATVVEGTFEVRGRKWWLRDARLR